MSMEVTQLLINAQSIDGTVRKHAEENLNQFQEQNLAGFLVSLAAELANDEKPVDSRKLAGLVLKNALDAKEQHTKFELVQRWLSLDMAIKSRIKAFLLKTLYTLVSDVRSIASLVIAKVACIELPRKQWPSFIGSLLLNFDQLPPHVKQATLETLGYLCEEVSPDVVEQKDVKKILTAVVQGMDAAEGNNDVRLAAIRALNMALGFTRANFDDHVVLVNIVSVVSEAILSPEVKIRQASFECLASMATYYEQFAYYTQGISEIITKAIREDEFVALHAIEFWSSICEWEIDFFKGYSEVSIRDTDYQYCFLVQFALDDLVPALLETLLKQEEDQDLDEGAWNIAMAGGACLRLVARFARNEILPYVIPFVKEKISKPNWRDREAATYALGLILEDPSADRLMGFVNAAFTFMLNSLTNDPSNHVRATTAWTLGRIFEFLHGSAMETPIVTQGNCQQIITVLIQAMKDAPNVAEKSCGALYFLAKGYEDFGPNSPLIPFFQEIIESLLAVAHREDATESRLRAVAYEVLNEVVRCSSDETATMVLQLAQVIMMELHNTLEGEKQNELQGLLCGCLHVIIQKLGSEPTKYAFMQNADQMMRLFLRVLGCRTATAHEEAMLAIGALTYAAGPYFAKYMPVVYKYLEMGIKNFEEYQVCAITVGVVGDICIALEDQILPYCDGIMRQLRKVLSRNQLHRSVKPLIFSCYGDIAFAIRDNFEKHLTYSIPLLQSAAELSYYAFRADDETRDNSNSLRIGILEAYSGIFQGFKNSPKIQLLFPYAPLILEFLDGIFIRVDMDKVVIQKAIGVLGDIADTLGSPVLDFISRLESSNLFLDECLSSSDRKIKEAAEWAMFAIKAIPV